MRILRRYRGTEKTFDEPCEAVVLGRPREGVHVDIDLTPDLRVSRPHARISIADGDYWIEDLGSANGTELDGHQIKGKGKLRLEPGQTIRISDTTIAVEIPVTDPGVDSDDKTLVTTHDTRLDIDAMIDAAAPVFEPGQPIDPARAQDLSLLYELPLRFGEETELDTLFQTIIERLVAIIPAASRGALLLTDSESGALLLKAHVPAGRPSVSMTLASRAMARREGFIWREGMDPSQSQFLNRIKAGMYVPLMWKGRALGAACVDNSDDGTLFTAEDLRLMLAVAHYAAMAAMQTQLQNDLRRNAALLSRLLTNFSPSVRNKLLSRAAHGRLRPGGEKSEVVILVSDIRGFTLLSSGMDTDDVVDLLNDYFSALTDAIFQHDGTIDKITGDAILAVFGCPEPDTMRHEKAVRAALAMQSAMTEVSEQRKRRGQVTCTIGIGVHCGEVLHGFIGSNDRMELTVIGEAANWTARYCDGAAGGEVLISPALHQRLWRYVDAELTAIGTKHEGRLSAYRLKGIKRAAG
ncbi:MAG TPA: adenylate/guanylate cyclase domain-containing protein [Stellaceae bacterium]|nr:adenylate/guanylate cyclase domain-containing protein [Stellaceae bacterium]